MSDDSNSKLGQELKQYLSEELSKTATLSQEQFRSLVEPWMASIGEAVVFVKQLQQTWIGWVEAHQKEIIVVGQFVQNAARVAGELVVATAAASKRFQKTLSKMEKMARLGWTFPTQLSLAELSEFVELEDSISAEAFMLRKFEEADPLFEQMENRLIHGPHLQDFGTVLPQCFRAIRSGDYAIAVPNLIAMLESIVQQLNPPHLAADTDVKRTLEKRGVVARQAECDILCAAVWLSLHTVVEKLWTNYPLQRSDIEHLPRHAIQHGRIEAPNSKGEVLRLLNTLETGLGLHDLLSGALSLEIPEVQGSKSEHKVVKGMLRASFYLPRRM